MKSLNPLFISNPVFERVGYPAGHPLAIARVGPVMQMCRMLGWLDSANGRESSPAELATLLTFHDPEYIEALQRVSAEGRASEADRKNFGLGTAENPVFAGMLERIALSVGGSIQAATCAMEGRAVFHPAGGTHHGKPNRASGFCYSNDPAFAIFQLLACGAGKVAYVDLDAHHGDGVEAAFSNEPRVLCISVHESGRWPGTGKTHGRTARNYPVPQGFEDDAFQQLLANEILPALQQFAPDAIVLTCGADALKGDPLSRMCLSNHALWAAITTLIDLAPAAVVLGGGGYNPWTTVRYWSGLWASMNGFEIPTPLPSDAQSLLQGLQCDLVDEDEMDPQWLTSLTDRRRVLA
jgi:acetoin utilization protein AcuC